MQRYDICLIGAASTGSAAAQYCSILLNGKVRTLLIGPDEPNEKVILISFSQQITCNFCMKSNACRIMSRQTFLHHTMMKGEL